MMKHSQDNKVKLIHNVNVETESNKDVGSTVKGVKRVINGQLLEKVQANYDNIVFRRDSSYDYSIEQKITPEFKEV